MASIQANIDMFSQYNSIFCSMINMVNLVLSAMDDMRQGMNAGIDASGIEDIRNQIGQTRNEITQATTAINDMNEALNRQAASNNASPVRWESGGPEVFTGTPVERYRQEIQSANTMLQQLCSTQDAIARQAGNNTHIFPPEASRDLNSMATRMDIIRDRIQQIENNPLNMGSDAANSELEQLRTQMFQMTNIQNELSEAMQKMDVSAANAAYLRLNQIISGTERHLRDNVNEQDRFNQDIQEGTTLAGGLSKMIKNVSKAYDNIKKVGKVLNISDELAQTTFQLGMINNGAETAREMVNMVYLAAQNVRGSFAEMADTVVRFGTNANNAFDGPEEMVAFVELIQKQMAVAGASTQETSDAMSRLSQALGSGVLKGDELNSLFKQAPDLVQSIADYMNVPIDRIREMASEGGLSADVIKAAIFASADEINAKFNEIPMTWGQIWQSLQNSALIAFQPILQRLNDIANSEAFQTFIDDVVDAMAALANILLNIFELAAAMGGFIADNWSIIGSIIYGVIAALAVYAGYLEIINAAHLISEAATRMVTQAQRGLNVAFSSCPIVGIIMLIIALVAVIFAVCNAIAKMTGVADSGFGVICGGVNVVLQFFKNLFLGILNLSIGISNAIEALGSNIFTAFHNAICSVQARFYLLLSTALFVVAEICKALNKLPFVEFDYSGISSAADDYAAKAVEAAGNKEDYQSIIDAFKDGNHTFDTFESGWASEAFNAGASWGDGVAEAIDNFRLSDLFGSTLMSGSEEYKPSPGDYIPGLENVLENLGNGDDTENIADDTGVIRDSVEVTSEDLKYLRDIAEMEAVNRFTTAEIHIDMSGMQNTVNGGNDLDGFMTKLTDSVNEAVENMTEGVHE